MAGKKENIKALFSNTRTRVIILFTVILFCITVAIGYFKFSGSIKPTLSAGANLKRVSPNIRSIPGALDPTAQYAGLQEQQNINQAETAAKIGGSAIPTLIKTQKLGNGIDILGKESGEGGLGFTALSTANLNGVQKDLWIQTLKNDNCSRSAIKKVVEQGGSIVDLYGACSCAILRDYGYTLPDLVTACSCPELKAIAFTASELKAVGYTADKLKRCGFSACETRGAEFSAEAMREGGFSDGELRGAGFSALEVAQASGLPEGIIVEDIADADCDVDTLKAMRAKGVSAAVIQRGLACPPANFKAAGFSAADLKRAGITAAALLADGFSAAELKQGGYDGRDLLKAGLTAKDLAGIGFTPEEIDAAQRGLSSLPASVLALQKNGDRDNVGGLKIARAAGVSARVIRDALGSSVEAMKLVGYTAQELKDAGYHAAELDNGGFSLKELKDAGYSVSDLRATGYIPKELKDAGFRASDQISAGFSAEDLKQAGYSDSDLKTAGFSAEATSVVTKAGAKTNTPIPKSLRGMEKDRNNVNKLRAARLAGVSAGVIRDAIGSSAEAMKAAGFTLEELKAAGYTAKDLKALGYTAEQLKSLGYTAEQLKEAGFDLQQLESAGYTVQQLQTAGYTAQQLKAAGYTAEQLRAAGYTAEQLKNAGFNAEQLKAGGYTAEQLNNAGYTGSQLKAAGFTARQLKALGSTVEELKALGYSMEQLEDAGFNVSDLGDAASVSESESLTLDNIGSASRKRKQPQSETKELQALMARQKVNMSDQRNKEKMRRSTDRMLSAARDAMKSWTKVSTQVFIEGSSKDDEDTAQTALLQGNLTQSTPNNRSNEQFNGSGLDPSSTNSIFIKTGDILFAVLDTSVNTDEPGPILATIVSGKLKGSKLIGSFTLPGNANKMVLTFNTLSMLGADKTISISSYAIDPNTARTALAGRVNHHYLMRYGSLFASTFLAGFSSAIQSADTTISIGGTGGTTDTTVQNGINRSLLENALIGLGEVGKAWSETAQQLMNRPTTVELYSGTGMGILFTQDVQLA